MSLRNALPAVLLAIGLSAAAHAGDDSCKVIFDADRKMILTAHHSSTEVLPAHKDPRLGETIYTGGLNGPAYIMVSGKWQRSPLTPEDSLKQKEENTRNTKAFCHYVRDEAVNGEAAAVYSIQTENEDSKWTGTVWIGKSKGMPLKEEMNFDMGMHMAVRYDYSNVRPLDGVK